MNLKLQITTIDFERSFKIYRIQFTKYL